MSLYLDIVSPDQLIYQGEVESITLPGKQGTFQVLKDHAPIISALSSGLLLYENTDGSHSLQIDGGVVEVLKNKITVLAESIA